MEVQLLSLNVRRLNARNSVSLLRRYLKSVPSLDVIFFQEHKLRFSAAPMLGRSLWKDALAWCLDANLGYRHAIDEEGAEGRCSNSVGSEV